MLGIIKKPQTDRDVAQKLACTSALKQRSLNYHRQALTTESLIHIARLIATPGNSVEKIDLSCNFLDANLSRINHIDSSAAWYIFAQALRNPNCKVIELNLSGSFVLKNAQMCPIAILALAFNPQEDEDKKQRLRIEFRSEMRPELQAALEFVDSDSAKTPLLESLLVVRHIAQEYTSRNFLPLLVAVQRGQTNIRQLNIFCPSSSRDNTNPIAELLVVMSDTPPEGLEFLRLHLNTNSIQYIAKYGTPSWLANDLAPSEQTGYEPLHFAAENEDDKLLSAVKKARLKGLHIDLPSFQHIAPEFTHETYQDRMYTDGSLRLDEGNKQVAAMRQQVAELPRVDVSRVSMSRAKP